jgi:hypothetical protein
MPLIGAEHCFPVDDALWQQLFHALDIDPALAGRIASITIRITPNEVLTAKIEVVIPGTEFCQMAWPRMAVELSEIKGSG